MGTTPITLLKRATGRAVVAELLDGLVPEDLTILESVWSPERSRILLEMSRLAIPQEELPESLRWNWRAKAQHLRFDAASCFAVACEDQWQGAVLTKSGTHTSRLGEARGKPLIYIEFLEVAPWNWTVPAIGQFGVYGLTGPRLFERVVRQSWDSGFDGRIALHSLPQSESFYRNACRMMPLGSDDDHDGLTYFELSRDNAHRILEQSV